MNKWIKTVKTDAVEKVKKVEVENIAVLLIKSNGKYYAINDTCSHESTSLSTGDLEENVITCPKHGARFDITNGKVLSFPATKNIPVYPVKVENGELYIQLEPD